MFANRADSRIMEHKGECCTMHGETRVIAPQSVAIARRLPPRSEGREVIRLNAAATHRQSLGLLARGRVRGEAFGHQSVAWKREDVTGCRPIRLPSGLRWAELAMICALTSTIAIGIQWVRAWWAMP